MVLGIVRNKEDDEVRERERDSIIREGLKSHFQDVHTMEKLLKKLMLRQEQSFYGKPLGFACVWVLPNVLVKTWMNKYKSCFSSRQIYWITLKCCFVNL